MGLSKMIKTNARRALDGGWGRAIGVLLLVTLPSLLLHVLEFVIRAIGGVSSFVDYNGTTALAFDDMYNVSLVSALVSLLMLLLTFIVIVPLTQGAYRWFYRRTAGENDGVGELFFYFETARGYFKSLWLNIQIGVRMLFWIILLSAPMAAGSILLGMLTQGNTVELPPSLTAIAFLLAFVWSVLEIFLLIMLGLRYFLAPYLLAEHPGLRGRRTVKKSIRLMRGHKMGIFGFYLSFLPWWLPAIFSVLLPFFMIMADPSMMGEAVGAFAALFSLQILMLFYICPYMNTACAMYARYLIQSSEAGEAAEAGLPEITPAEDENMTREYDRQEAELGPDAAEPGQAEN